MFSEYNIYFCYFKCYELIKFENNKFLQLIDPMTLNLRGILFTLCAGFTVFIHNMFWVSILSTMQLVFSGMSLNGNTALNVQVNYYLIQF